MLKDHSFFVRRNREKELLLISDDKEKYIFDSCKFISDCLCGCMCGRVCGIFQAKL